MTYAAHGPSKDRIAVIREAYARRQVGAAEVPDLLAALDAATARAEEAERERDWQAERHMEALDDIAGERNAERTRAERAEADRDALARQVHRLIHDEEIESDRICDHELQATDAERERDELRAALWVLREAAQRTVDRLEDREWLGRVLVATAKPAVATKEQPGK